MSLLPFDLLSARVLSLVLLGLIALLSHAQDPMRAGTSLVRNDAPPSCATGYVPSAAQSGWNCGRVSRHPIKADQPPPSSF